MNNLKCDYLLCLNKNGLSNPHSIKFSLSHFISALCKKHLTFKQGYYYKSLQQALQLFLINKNSIYLVLNKNMNLLTNNERIHLSNLMHAFGYYIFEDILKQDRFNQGINLLFLKRKGRVYLLDQVSRSVMSFYHNLNSKTEKYSLRNNKNFFLYLLNTNSKAKKHFQLPFKNGKFLFFVYDPPSYEQKYDERINEWREKYRTNLNCLKDVLVKTDKDGMLSVNETKFVYVIWEAFKEYVAKTEKEIKDLKCQIEKLKGE